MVNYKLIIPSYKRPDTLIKKTLKSIYKTDIVKNIYVFVADDLELIEYKNKLESYKDIKIIKGVRGIPNQRNFIQKYFDDNEYLVFLMMI